MSIRFLGLRTVIYPAPDLAVATALWSEFLGTAPYFHEPFDVGFNPVATNRDYSSTVETPDSLLERA